MLLRATLCAAIAIATIVTVGCSSPERQFSSGGEDTGTAPVDTGTVVVDTGTGMDTGMPEDTGMVEDTGTMGDAPASTGGYTSTATVPGGMRAESASYILITTTGQAPGGNAVLSSSSYTLKGGIVSVTQP